MATLIAILTTLKPLLAPLVTFLVGVLFPSPIQKTLDRQGKVHEAEKKADESGGNVSDLDSLP